ncbi:MAG: putative cytidine and deoxycytidylate deaminase [Nocardioidaceae bacterium]|nr:putative cytidine and deoxycytidylate deaminase [Nocardioidaceae bacterium]
MTPVDLEHLRRCVALAEEALDAGDLPFGSVLVDAAGAVRAEDRNRELTTGDATRHPELDLARWAALNLTPAERAGATVYTSGEHCPMCSAAHAWVGLGRIVYAVASATYAGWLAEWGSGPSPVTGYAAAEVAPEVVVEGPAPELEDAMRALHRRAYDAR